MKKSTVENVLKMIEDLPGVSDGKHKIEIIGGLSKHWWDNCEESVKNIELTATKVKLYI